MSYKNTQRWRYKAREWITIYAGGKCQSCGYNTCHANLCFHHIDPAIKIAGVCRLINLTYSWDTIVAEADKCVLVCLNCHGEIHAGIRECPILNLEERHLTYTKLLRSQPESIGATKLPPNMKLEREYHFCRCGAKISINKKHCSRGCVSRSQEKTIWPDNLPELVANSSALSIARSLNVSDKAVAKRLKNHH